MNNFCIGCGAELADDEVENCASCAEDLHPGHICSVCGDEFFVHDSFEGDLTVCGECEGL